MTKSENVFVSPVSIESELYILYCLSVDIAGCKNYDEFHLIKPDYFSDVNNRIIYEAIMYLESNGDNVDVLSMMNYLKENGTFSKIGGIEKLLSIADSELNSSYYNTLTFNGFVTHYRIMCDKYRQRRLIDGANEILINGFENVDKSKERLVKLYDEIAELENEQMFANRPMRVSELDKYSKEHTIDLIHSSILGVPLKAGEMTVITSKSGSAKTTYASALLVELANEYPSNKFFYYWKEDTVDKYLRHFKHLKNDNVFFDKNLKFINHLPNEIKKHRPKAIILDGFGLFEIMNEKGSQTWEMRDKKAIMLSNIAMDYQIAIILTAQFNDGKAINFQREMVDANIGSSREVINSSGRVFEIATIEPNGSYPIDNIRKIICLKNRHKYEEGKYSKMDSTDNYYYTHCYFDDYKLYNLGKNILRNDYGQFVPIN